MAGGLCRWHARYCAEIDLASERAHMALRDAGVDALLVKTEVPFCGRGWHLTGNAPVDDEVAVMRAAAIAMGPEMYAGWLEALAEDGQPVLSIPSDADVIVR